MTGSNGVRSRQKSRKHEVHNFVHADVFADQLSIPKVHGSEENIPPWMVGNFVLDVLSARHKAFRTEEVRDGHDSKIRVVDTIYVESRTIIFVYGDSGIYHT